MRPVVTSLVVAKAPVAGTAKTRLMAALTPEQAAQVASAALLDTLDAVLGSSVGPRTVALVGDVDAAVGADELRRSLARFTVIPQRGDGFGARLAHAHADAGPGPVFQIGMDTPQVDSALLDEACAELAAPGVDAVLGPAQDGGWWGLGVREARLAGVLRTVPMSRHDTGQHTLAALRATGARVALLPTLRDVDTPADLAPVAAAAPGTRFAGLVATLAGALA